MNYVVGVRGSGSVEVAAYGVADAEHQVEKEVRALWPEARVEITQIRRQGDAPRIAELYQVEYRLLGRIRTPAPDPPAAKRAAFRRVRSLLAGTPYARIALEAVSTEPEEAA